MTPSLFSNLAIGRIPACFFPKRQGKDRQRYGTAQVATASKSVRKIFKGLENGDGTALSEGVRHQRQPLDESLTSKEDSRSFNRPRVLGKRESGGSMFNKCAEIATMLCAAALSGTPNMQAQKSEVKNIVLARAAWADGSGWKGVYNILVKERYNASIVQEPETSFGEDAASARRMLAQHGGPCILVAHSYGGAVITEAGTDPSVAGLAYFAAHMPDSGEAESDDG